MAETSKPTNVRLDPEIRERLDAYAHGSRRTLVASMNLLLDFALTFAESGRNLDDLMSSAVPTTTGEN